jgi:CelD/BcsL family acetyltransferase involved in cellulose biosynthesis
VRGPDTVVAPDDAALPVAEWNDLAESTGGSFFQTGTWAVAWWDRLAGRPETRIGLWRDPEGALEAVCAVSRVNQPLLRSGGPAVRMWVNTGSGAGAGDHLGWPARPGLRHDMVSWATGSTSGPIVLSNLTANATDGLAEAGFSKIEDNPTLVAALGSGDDWFPGSPDFAKKLRYFERQLDKLGISVGMVPASGIDDTVFRRLLELHAVRAEGMGWGSSFDTDREAFHRHLIDGATERRGPMACVARLDGDIVGVLYGFRFGATFAYYQTGWSQDYVKQSLGSVLVSTAMRHAAETGATTFDFLRGDDAYKRRFGAVPSADTTWSLQRGMAGAAVGLRRKAAEAVKGRVR